jgi:hypothetical protein
MINAAKTPVYASMDGGNAWRVAPTTGIPSECGDPRVEAMPDGGTVAICDSVLCRKAAEQDSYQVIPGLPTGLSNFGDFGNTGSWLVAGRMLTGTPALIMSEDRVSWKETQLWSAASSKARKYRVDLPTAITGTLRWQNPGTPLGGAKWIRARSHRPVPSPR